MNLVPSPKRKQFPITPQPQPKTQSPKHEDEIPEEPEQKKAAPELMPFENNITTTPHLEISDPVTSMVKRHLNSFQQQQQHSMAEQASRAYQQRKNSPIINAKIKHPFMSKDEKFRDSLKVRADCSSTGKKTAAVLLGLLGGSVDCSKPPPINGFINKRLNKESIFPRAIPTRISPKTQISGD